MRYHALRFCCRGVRRSRAAPKQNITRAAAPRKRPGQQQARVSQPLGEAVEGKASKPARRGVIL